MSYLFVLSVFVFRVFVWEESSCDAVGLNSVLLNQIPEGGEGGGGGNRGEGREGGGGANGVEGGAVGLPQRKKRSWVWNQFFVLEEQTANDPLYVGKLHSDVDKGDRQVRYVLSGEGAASIFVVDEETGDVHATKRLDREQQPFFTLRAQVRDRKTDRLLEPESEFIVKVQDVNDNEPKFLDGPYAAWVPERSPAGTSVVTVVATDDDDPTYGNSARLVYSLLTGQPHFTVEPHTGVIRTALPDLDRESRVQYLLVVQATDLLGQRGGLSGTTSVTVTLTDVNDNPPRFPRKSYQFSFPESVLVSSVVAKIRALDPDVGPNAELDYKVLDGDGTFRIINDHDTQEGLVILQKNLDFETKSSYLLHIEVSNPYVDARFVASGPFRDVTELRLLVENVDELPVFSSAISRMAISEAAAVGADVGSVSAQDPDNIHSPVRYSIDPKSDPQRFFNIHSLSGLITTARTLDRELTAVHNISVLATEILDLSQVGKTVVLVSVMDVNDNAPSLAEDRETFVCENEKPGQIIEILSAVDPDDPVYGHEFRFSLSTDSSGDLSFFSIRDNKDNTATLLNRRSGFSRQDRPVHVLVIVISDGGSPALSSTNTLSVTVCDCDIQGRQLSCSQGALPAPEHSFSSAAVATLICVLTALGVTMVTVVVKLRWGVALMVDVEGDIHEDIVHYDDEGGGEEDTEAFDIFTLRHLNQTNPTSQNLVSDPSGLHLGEEPGEEPGRDQQFQVFIRERLQEADLDQAAPPYDSLQTYAFEGSESAAESLSSLSSLSSLNLIHSSESGQNYNFLRAWGPRFKRLADLYGQDQGGVYCSGSQGPQSDH